jgi:hypothetical protein
MSAAVRDLAVRLAANPNAIRLAVAVFMFVAFLVHPSAPIGGGGGVS